VTSVRQPSVSPATTAAWRRRREASTEPLPPSAAEQPSNGLHFPDSQPGNDPHPDGQSGNASHPSDSQPGNGRHPPDGQQGNGLHPSDAQLGNGFHPPDGQPENGLHSTGGQPGNGLHPADGQPGPSLRHVNGQAPVEVRRRKWRPASEAHQDSGPARPGGQPANGQLHHINGQPGTGFRIPAYAPGLPPPVTAANGFAESQQAGLAAMLSIAKAIGPTQAPPIPGPRAPEPGPPAAPPDPPSAVPAQRPPDPAELVVLDRPGQAAPPDTAPPGRLAARRAKAAQRQRDAWHRFIQSQTLPLAVILTVQALLSLRLIWSNTAFTDEGLYLWSGRLEWAHWLHATPIPNFPSYFSGSPDVYPPLGAMATALGGLTAARMLSLCFMLVATALLHGVTRRLFGLRPANFAAALFAGLGATQFLGAFATYDAMALMLLALATWLSVRAGGSRLAVQLPLLIAAAGALALADAAKYAATLFDPIVIGVAGLLAWRAGCRKNGIFAALAMTSAVGLLLGLGLRLGGPVYWRGITHTTLARAHGGSSAAGIVADSLGWVAVVVILAVIGSAVAITMQPALPMKLCACLLASAVVLAPGNQARIHVFTSLFKHVGFGAWFAAAVAGYALASLANAVPAVKQRGAAMTSAGVAVAGLLIGASLAQTHYLSWPKTTEFTAKLGTLLPAHKGNVLAADNGNVIEYYLPDELQGMIFYGPWFLHYRDPASGKVLAGRSAYADAIKHGYFSVIALSFGDSRATDQAITRDISTYGGYQLISTLPYHAGGRASSFRIWVRVGPG
jgi:hypothetical protein